MTTGNCLNLYKSGVDSTHHVEKNARKKDPPSKKYHVFFKVRVYLVRRGLCGLYGLRDCLGLRCERFSIYGRDVGFERYFQGIHGMFKPVSRGVYVPVPRPLHFIFNLGLAPSQRGRLNSRYGRAHPD